MLLARHDIAVERGGNVVKPQPQMVLRRDTRRPLQADFVAEQRHDMAGAAVFDGFLQTRKRADVNHGIKRLPLSLSYRCPERRKCDAGVYALVSFLKRSK